MAIETKTDAVMRFKPLMTAVYGRLNDSHFMSDGQPIHTFGVTVVGKYAYAGNNHLVGKIYIPDGNPPPHAVYWDFSASEADAIKASPLETGELQALSGYADQQMPLFFNFCTEAWEAGTPSSFAETNIKTLKSFFFNWRDNLLKIRKEEILKILQEHFGRRLSEMAKWCLLIKAIPETAEIELCLMRIAKKDTSGESVFRISMHIAPGRDPWHDYRPPAICGVSVFYLYHVLQAFPEYDFLDLCFDNKFSTPIILKGVNPRDASKPDIRFAIAQSRPKYDFLGKELY